MPLLLLYARGQATRYAPATLAIHLARLQGAGLTDRTELPTPLQALDLYGGAVEGLLLLAYPDGSPRDEFRLVHRGRAPHRLPAAPAPGTPRSTTSPPGSL